MKGRTCRTDGEVSNRSERQPVTCRHLCSRRRDHRQDVSGGKSCDHRVFAQTGPWRVSHWHCFGLQHLASPIVGAVLAVLWEVMTQTRQRFLGEHAPLSTQVSGRGAPAQRTRRSIPRLRALNRMWSSSGCGGTYCDGSADRRRFQVPGHPHAGSGRHLATRPLRNAAEPVGRRLLANFGQPRKRECRE